MYTFIFSSIRVSFRMISKFFKADGKLISLPCEKWVLKEGKQFTLFNCVKIERKEDEFFRQTQFTKFEVTDENGKELIPYDHTQNIWWFESLKRIKVLLRSNGVSAELRAEYVASENGVYRLKIDNPDKHARLIEKPETESKPVPTAKPTPLISTIDPKSANKIAGGQMNPDRKREYSKNHGIQHCPYLI